MQSDSAIKFDLYTYLCLQFDLFNVFCEFEISLLRKKASHAVEVIFLVRNVDKKNFRSDSIDDKLCPLRISLKYRWSNREP